MIRTCLKDTRLKPFLKWPGGKFRLVDRIRASFGHGNRLIEPFTGSAAVFLNTDFDHYILADSNPDLIRLFEQLVDEGEDFIHFCRSFFTPGNNTPDRYYALREEFNLTEDTRNKSALFLYLNRHCYNGLCRYNSRGAFNTPFGSYTRPYFPEKEMFRFIHAAGRAEFLHAIFADSMMLAGKGDIVYCDPPYAPLSTTAYFTDYHSGGFKWEDQILLAQTAGDLAERGARVVISNHDTKPVRDLYRQAGARIKRFQVRRNISCNAGTRGTVGELLAVFG